MKISAKFFLFSGSTYALVNFPVATSILSIRRLTEGFSSTFSDSVLAPDAYGGIFPLSFAFSMSALCVSHTSPFFAMDSPTSVTTSTSCAECAFPFPRCFPEFFVYAEGTLFSPFVSAFVGPTLFPFVLPSCGCECMAGLFVLVCPPTHFMLFCR